MESFMGGLVTLDVTAPVLLTLVPVVVHSLCALCIAHPWAERALSVTHEDLSLKVLRCVCVCREEMDPGSGGYARDDLTHQGDVIDDGGVKPGPSQCWNCTFP